VVLAALPARGATPVPRKPADALRVCARVHVRVCVSISASAQLSTQGYQHDVLEIAIGDLKDGETGARQREGWSAQSSEKGER
jgi:hypothetical protein